VHIASERKRSKDLSVLEYRDKIRLEKIARDCGFEIVADADDDGLTFASSLVRERLRMEARSGAFYVKASSQALMDEVETNFLPGRSNCQMDGAFVATSSALTLHDVTERMFQLSMSMPSRPLDVFRTETANLPKTTEAERLAVLRVGQNIFREALDKSWAGKCAVTGVADRALLRASHVHPWAECATDDERLDAYNGVLLIADLDAAFDAALISFDASGWSPATGSMRRRSMRSSTTQRS
jgi:putative restriction endonuclease